MRTRVSKSRTPLENLYRELVGDFPEGALVSENLYIVGLVLGVLTERERFCVSLRYGLEDGLYYNTGQIANHFNVTEARVRRLFEKAGEKLRTEKNIALFKVLFGHQISKDDFDKLMARSVPQTPIYEPPIDKKRLKKEHYLIGIVQGLTPRGEMVLKRSGYSSLLELEGVQMVDILKLKNMSKLSAQYIFDACDRYGVALRKDLKVDMSSKCLFPVRYKGSSKEDLVDLRKLYSSIISKIGNVRSSEYYKTFMNNCDLHKEAKEGSYLVEFLYEEISKLLTTLAADMDSYIELKYALAFKRSAFIALVDAYAGTFESWYDLDWWSKGR